MQTHVNKSKTPAGKRTLKLKRSNPPEEQQAIILMPGKTKKLKVLYIPEKMLDEHIAQFFFLS